MTAAVSHRSGELPHLVLRMACAEPQSRVELASRVEQRHGLRASANAIRKATLKLARAGLLRLAGRVGRACRYVLTSLGEELLDDLDVDLWWQQQGQVAA